MNRQDLSIVVTCLKENGSNVDETWNSGYSYPRYSSRALAEILRLGFAVKDGARRDPPAAHSIIVVTNANDTAVNPIRTEAVVKDWREHNANLATY
jgi:hypothetical protein